MNYSYKKEIDLLFRQAVEKVKIELKKEGFGIITKINVKKTLKDKLQKDYENYIILGACNPFFAHKALLIEKEIGLLLPCNVAIFQDKNKIFVSTILPTVAINLSKNEKLAKIAQEVEKKLKKVINRI